jgi:hypothetical protein
LAHRFGKALREGRREVIAGGMDAGRESRRFSKTGKGTAG